MGHSLVLRSAFPCVFSRRYWLSAGSHTIGKTLQKALCGVPLLPLMRLVSAKRELELLFRFGKQSKGSALVVSEIPSRRTCFLGSHIFQNRPILF